MFIIGKQELFQSAGLYFMPFYLKIVDILYVLSGTSECYIVLYEWMVKLY